MTYKFQTFSSQGPFPGSDAIWELVSQQQHEREFERTFTNTFLSWQSVEQQLFLIFNSLNPNSNTDRVSASFHAVISLDGRLGMITALVQMQFEKKSPLLTKWGQLSNKTKKVSKKRNHLAHFSLHKYAGKDGKELRLRPSIFDARPSGKDYGVEEMQQFGFEFKKLEEELLRFNSAVQRLGLR